MTVTVTVTVTVTETETAVLVAGWAYPAARFPATDEGGVAALGYAAMLADPASASMNPDVVVTPGGSVFARYRGCWAAPFRLEEGGTAAYKIQPRVPRQGHVLVRRTRIVNDGPRSWPEADDTEVAIG